MGYIVRFLNLHTLQDDWIRVSDMFNTLDINHFCVMYMKNPLYYLFWIIQLDANYSVRYKALEIITPAHLYLPSLTTHFPIPAELPV